MKNKTMTLEQHRLLREVKQLMTNAGVDNSNSKAKTDSNRPALLTQQVGDFLTSHYDFRYNVLTEETEFRPAGECGTAFLPIGKRELNTFCIEAHSQGISCWDKDLSRYIYSTYIPGYHPFHLYMKELPEWDGKDRLKALAHRVSSDHIWVNGFHIWMLAMAGQWAGLQNIHANSVAPILISSEQGRHKSTFCKALMPPILQRYYSDNLKLSAQGNPERLLAEMGLLNMDEFDKYGPQKMPLLKNLMQMSSLNICKAYQKNFRNLPRIASFIGTSNRFDLLNDPTGSRRFICIEVERVIDCDGIEYNQIYSQLKSELAGGARCWFTKEEEKELQCHNTAYYHACPAEEVFHTCFRSAMPGEECEQLSAATIYKILKTYNSAAMRNSNPGTFGQVLSAAGAIRKHTKYGNVYLVVRR